MLNTLASVFAHENDLDNAILLNENKGVVEATNGNIFIVKDHVIKTPALTEGCIKGVTRGKIIEIISERTKILRSKKLPSLLSKFKKQTKSLSPTRLPECKR